MSARRSIVCFSPYPEDGPSVRYRIYQYSNIYRNNDIGLTVKPFMTRSFYRNRRRFGLGWKLYKIAMFLFCSLRLLFRLVSVPRYDLAIIHREAFPIGPPLMEKMICKLARRSVYDVDDAIWHKPSNAVNQRDIFWDENRVGKIMSSCDHVVVCNDYLGAYASGYNQSVTNIQTPYHAVIESTGRVVGDRKTELVWIGNLGNAIYMKGVLVDLAESHLARKVRVRLVGGEDIFDLDTYGLDVKRVLWSPSEEVKALSEGDIGLMPLPDKDYEKGKCGFKIVQYFSASMPVIVSPVGVNCEIVKEGQTGYLASGKNEWLEAIDKLSGNPALREEMGANGRKDFDKKYSLEVNAEKWLVLIQNLIG